LEVTCVEVFFEKVWENRGKIPSHTQKFACSETYETYSIAQKKQLCFYCRIMLLALHIALICSTTFRLRSGSFQTRTATSSFAWFTHT